MKRDALQMRLDIEMEEIKKSLIPEPIDKKIMKKKDLLALGTEEDLRRLEAEKKEREMKRM